jgi:predicted HD superfamily hydrolase involved in NAD metabolism
VITEKRFLEIKNWLQGQVSFERLNHIEGVVKTAAQLAERNGVPQSKVKLAAWLHDCGKELTRAEMKRWLKKSRFNLDKIERQLPGLWHPHVGAAIAQIKWGIKDKSILDAIRSHTLGHPAMKPLSQVVFIADFIEPGRDFPGVDKARNSAQRSLRMGVLAKSSMTIEFLFRKNMKIHPRLLETWNSFLIKRTE